MVKLGKPTMVISGCGSTWLGSGVLWLCVEETSSQATEPFLKGLCAHKDVFACEDFDGANYFLICYICSSGEAEETKRSCVCFLDTEKY